ncbi:hypothetical protein DICVIV_01492 [Dictyocaulus viviparus]|uniref:Uncharacterized protein n=1 Tax=Dictyocaulus viviparus TaxID=29172 RepID=A0A0D8Y6E8_DICVI|nr:hypothetical protein DICVIV_01492 [Dictyocaulus viviparus]
MTCRALGNNGRSTGTALYRKQWTFYWYCSVDDRRDQNDLESRSVTVICVNVITTNGGEQMLLWSLQSLPATNLY